MRLCLVARRDEGEGLGEDRGADAGDRECQEGAWDVSVSQFACVILAVLCALFLATIAYEVWGGDNDADT